MRHRDFCYWLQGAMELFDPTVLTEEQVTSIHKHLDMVSASQRRVSPRHLSSDLVAFCRSLRVILGGSKTLVGDELRVVKKLLNAAFVHIDKDTEGNPDELDHLHGGDGTPRC